MSTRNERQVTPFVNFTARLPYDLYERALDFKDGRRDLSLAAILRDALTEYLDRQENGNER